MENKTENKLDESLLDMEDELMDISTTHNKTRSEHEGSSSQSGGGTTPTKSASKIDSSGGDYKDRLSYVYKVVRSERLASMQYIDSTGAGHAMKDNGSFEDRDPGSPELVHYRHVTEKNRNISLSFDPATMKCLCKGSGEHIVLFSSGTRVDCGQHPPVFMLTDQHAPPYIPSGEAIEKACVKVVRVENGTLHEMISVFLDILHGHFVPLGTVLVVSSLSHLSNVGVQSYCEDLNSASKRLYDRYSNGVRLVHGVTLPVTMMDDFQIRAWFCVNQWLQVSSPGSWLGETAGVLVRMISGVPSAEAGGEEVQQSSSMRFRLPQSVSKVSQATFELKDTGLLLKSKERLSVEEEATILEALLKELNHRFFLNLGTGQGARFTASECDDEEELSQVRLRVIVVGGSHGRRLLEAMEDMEVTVVDLTRPGFRVTHDRVSELAEKLERVLKEEHSGETLIVYHLLDNSCYLQGGEGDWRPLEKGEDNVYHAAGKIRLVDNSEAADLFKAVTVLFRAGKTHKKVIISPVERYVSQGCCGDFRHMTNHKTEFVGSLAERLTTIRRRLTDHVHLRRIPNYRVVSMHFLLGIKGTGGGESLKSYWGTDPVHMTGTGYATAAEAVMDLMVEEEDSFSNPPKAKSRDNQQVERSGWILNTGSGEAGPSAKRGRYLERGAGPAGWGHRGKGRGRW